jgi:uncharacterized protein (DUF362 family)
VISRRSFLRGLGATAAGLLAAGCRPELGSQVVEPTATPTPAPTDTPTSTPTTAPTDTATPTLPPTATPTTAPTATPGHPALARVAIAEAKSYDRGVIRQQVRTMLDGLGGLGDVIGSGDRVAVKVNLTGGTNYSPPAGLSSTESFLTHPEVVRALLELLRDAGAGEIYVVEAVYDDESYRVFGYEEVATDLGATLVDLNQAAPYADFTAAPVGEGWYIYDRFTFNPVLLEIDAFVSVAKLKCHFNCGITLAMKNLIGLVPAALYARQPDHWWRSAFHGASDEEAGTRLPRVIADLNRARPIHLALIDGIMTGEGGEAPRGSFGPVQPGVLVAGKNPVATDAVAAAVMGFDPTAESPILPFIRADNHLNLAHGLGLGTNRLDEIDVVGASIDDVVYEFEPSWELGGRLVPMLACLRSAHRA